MSILYFTSKEALKDIIKKHCPVAGLHHNFITDLSHIQVGFITDMSGLFEGCNFNVDISKWNVSSAVNMNEMFFASQFNGDISKWNVSKVEDMRYMFHSSEFNGDISEWDVCSVRRMDGMFDGSKFSGNISKWIKICQPYPEIFKFIQDYNYQRELKSLPNNLYTTLGNNKTNW